MSAIKGMEEIALVLAEVFGNKLAEIKQQAEKLAEQDLAAAKKWAESVVQHIRNAPSPADALAVHGETAQSNEPPAGGGSVAP